MSRNETNFFHCAIGLCQEDKPTFQTGRTLSNHKYQYHGKSYTLRHGALNDDEQSVTISRENDVLKCFFCDKTYRSVDSFKKHITDCKSECKKDDSEDSNTEEVVLTQNLVAVPTTTVMTTAPISKSKSDAQHDFDQAIMHACQSMDVTVEEHNKNKWILGQIKLEPFSLFSRDHNDDKIEYNAFSHHENVKNMSNRTLECKPIIPLKGSMDVNNIVSCNYAADLASLIHKSPHQQLLASRQYFELDETTTLLLNKDWMHEPHIKYACAQILAGAILLNTNNGESVLVNTIETYGRTKLVDIHRQLPSSSNLSALTTMPTYPNIWPHMQDTRDGSKLIISTQSCDNLITSIVRLDQNEEPKAGPSSFYFAASSHYTKIFIDQTSWTKAKGIEANSSTRSIVPFNLANQARQLGSQFDHPSTYYLCRASSDIALFNHLQPCTVFTYCEHEGSTKSMDNENASMIASRLFHCIIYSVIKSPAEACLNKDYIASLHNQCKNDGKIKKLFADLLDRFGEDTEMLIIGNKGLNNHVLKQMADAVSSDISKQNKTVATHIQKRLRTH
ncbi:hypothetical protein DM01DRAFT_1326125 [Hesseltinella vesiculosa]|uniref:Uncharacterized protein n=1 Tax=Hesseltinella vesiculosa TaxID=101127 RepID=A0A1X2GA78_9FUNG|nr:hypothetical protein DM01DRAFT_1326125 [Hesseltinella vesiculosa]